jgi:hypothetical protein
MLRRLRGDALPAAWARAAAERLPALGPVSWRRFALIGYGGCLAAVPVLFATLVLLDPYDSGRFPTLLPAGTMDTGPSTGNVSRGRDSRFAAAIVGNSHVQLLHPGRLAAESGRAFVQLTSPGSGPREQMLTLAWFARHRARIDAVVVGVDRLACTGDPAMPPIHPFPYWLYGDDLRYLAHLLNPGSVERAGRGFRIAFGARPAADPAGFVDYEADFRDVVFRPPSSPGEPADLTPQARPGLAFPGIDHLEAQLDTLPRATAVVFVMAPMHVGALPRAGSADALRMTGCKARLHEAVARRPRWAFLDFLSDDAWSRDAANFMDATHYRAPFARRIEAEIAAALRRLAPEAAR